MTPQKAEVLCDIATDRSKKLRVVVTDKDGKRLLATRTFGKKCSISLKPFKG